MKRIGIWTLTFGLSVIIPGALIVCTYIILIEKWYNWVMPKIDRFDKDLMED